MTLDPSTASVAATTSLRTILSLQKCRECAAKQRTHRGDGAEPGHRRDLVFVSAAFVRR